jgi:hypothetical protein
LKGRCACRRGAELGPSPGSLELARVAVLGEQAGNGHVVPGRRAPGAGTRPPGRGDGHRQHVGHAVWGRGCADGRGGRSDARHGAVVPGNLIGDGRRVVEACGLDGGQHGVLQHGAVGGSLGGRGADGVCAGAPNLLKLCGGDVGAIVGCNRRPELLAAGLVDGTETLRVDGLGAVVHIGVDAQAVVRLRRALGGQGAGLGKQDLVLAAAGRGRSRDRAHMVVTAEVHGGAVARRLRVAVVVNGRLANGAERGYRRHRRGAAAAVAAVGQLVEVQTAGKLSLLEVQGNVLVRHLLHAGLKQVVLLGYC